MKAATGFSFLMLSCFVLSVQGQTNQIKNSPASFSIDPNTLISKDLPQNPHTEPIVAVNPQNPHNIVVASIVITDAGKWTSSVLSTTDGQTWKRTLADTTDCGDPWVAFGNDGSLYFSALCGQKDSLGRTIDRIKVYRSSDGGHQWHGPVFVPAAGNDGRGAHDHPSLMVGDSGELYVLASRSYRSFDNPHTKKNDITINTSVDNGRTFSKPYSVYPTNLIHQAGMPVLASDGTLVLSFYDFATPDHQYLLPERRIWTVSSSDKGRTFSLPAYVGSVNEYTFFPVLAIDKSTRFPNRLYTLLPNIDGHVVVDSTMDIFPLIHFLEKGLLISISDDLGKKWSKPRLLFSTEKDLTHSVRNATIAVNSQGDIAVAWSESTMRDSDCFDLYITVSFDGGMSFLPKKKVNDTKNCPDQNTPGNIRGDFNVSRRWPAGGDYIGLASIHDHFLVVWADSRDGLFQLYASQIRIFKE